MPTADWHFDFISPFAYLQLGRIEALRARLDIAPRPVLLAALLAHHGNIGPAEIPSKRVHTYRFVQWQAETAGIPLRFPPAHPFNPLAALRLCIAAGTTWTAVRAIFDHLWREGRAGTNAQELAGVGRALGFADVAAAIDRVEVKAALRANTEAAIAAGIFGVPSVSVGGETFWGNDATPMLEDWLVCPERFAGAEYARLANLPVGIERPR